VKCVEAETNSSELEEEICMEWSGVECCTYVHTHDLNSGY